MVRGFALLGLGSIGFAGSYLVIQVSNTWNAMMTERVVYGFLGVLLILGLVTINGLFVSRQSKGGGQASYDDGRTINGYGYSVPSMGAAPIVVSSGKGRGGSTITYFPPGMQVPPMPGPNGWIPPVQNIPVQPAYPPQYGGMPPQGYGAMPQQQQGADQYGGYPGYPPMDGGSGQGGFNDLSGGNIW